ncbi:MAG: PH domain-containing protein [Verrucomicrobiales bacterium]|nr:PH domain-containing protein [Verrucomicrobiales bacterium]
MSDPAAPIYVLKGGARLGPFTVDDLLDLVDSGEISYDDLCLRQGAVDCERVRQVLDWEDGAAPPSAPGEEPVASLDGDEPDEDDEAWEEEDEDEIDDAVEESPAPPREPRRPVGPPRDPRLILYAGHPSVLSFPVTVLFILGSVAGGVWARENSGWWLFAGLVAALFGVSWILFQRSLRLYVVTPRRVETITGFIAKSSHEVRIEDIRAINVRKSGLPGLLGVGTVEFASAGGAAVDVAFVDVYAAHRIKGLVRRLQDAEK